MKKKFFRAVGSKLAACFDIFHMWTVLICFILQLWKMLWDNVDDLGPLNCFLISSTRCSERLHDSEAASGIVL